MCYDAFSDEELIAKLRRGENEVTDYILEKYKPLVRKRTNAMYLMGGETEDLIQEGMIGLFKAIRDYQEEREASFYHFAELCINRQLYSALQASNRKKHQPLNTYISFSSGESDDGVKVEDALLGQSQSPEQLVIEKEVWEDFKQRLNGRLSKMENQVLAFSDQGVYTFSGGNVPKEGPKKLVEQEIKMVFHDNNYFGLVFASGKDEAKRNVVVYNMKCDEQTRFVTDFPFEEIQFLDNHEICLTSNSMAALYTMGGLEKFYYEFNEPLYHMMHIKGYRNYAFVVEGKTQQVRFRLFGSGKAGEK